MLWEDLTRALALVLVIEGLLPFLSPGAFRKALLRFISLEDRWMRALGLASMVAGLLLLQL